MHWIEIFRTGAHTDSSGHTRTFTDADLDRMVTSFDTAQHEPPLVLGHPKTDAPAYGWVAALKREGGRLFAAFRDVPELVKELVAKGRYKKRSIAMYPDGRLRHVGLLGAATPAVDGLADIAAFEGGAFSEFTLAGGGAAPNSEPEGTLVNLQEMEQRLKALEAENALLKAKAGGADAAKIAELEAALKAAQAEKDQAVADKDATEKAFAAAKQEARAAELDRELEALVKEGKLLPQDKPKALAFAAALDASGAGGELEFTAGAGKKAVAAHFLDFLKFLPGNGLSGEFAAGGARSEPAAIPYGDIMNKV